MAEQLLEVHSTKLLYATIKKMLAVIDDYNNVKSALTYYFPQVLTDTIEWATLKINCISFIDKNTNWTGASPSNNSPDYIKSRTLPQINDDVVTHIYNRLNGNVTFGDDSVINFESKNTWTNVLTKFLQVLDLEEEYSMHKQVLGGLTGTNENIDKTPGQLSSYSECEMPLNTIEANTYAISNVLGIDTYYAYLPVYSLETASTEITTRFNTIITSVTTSESPYTHSTDVGCVLSITPSPSGIVTYDNKNTINYNGSGATEIRLLELHSDEEEAGGDPLTPTITSPSDGDTVISPITIQTNSLEISDGGFDYHEWTTWQIADSTDFSNILWQSEEDRDNLTEIVISDPENYLSLTSTYYIRIKQYGKNSGRTDWSDIVQFNTASTWDCTLGTESNGGIFAGILNDKCIVVSEFEVEPSYTNDFSVVNTESEQLNISATIGDMVYREDESLYYVNDTGSNADISTDWIQINVQEEDNSEIFADSESAMLSLDVVEGNICIRTDEVKCYVNKEGNNTAMSDWIEIDTPVKIWWIAEEYCSQLEHNGYDDWRLPTASELNAIQENMITIDTADTTGNFNVYKYWSSTTDVLDKKENAWVEDFNEGTQSTKDRDGNWFYVRAVRSV